MTSTPSIPTSVRTERLRLRRWESTDAAALLPLLEANVEHLGDWIPRHVSQPAPLPELTRRLTDFAARFDADREWRFAIFAAADNALLGEVDLFPRADSGRVPLAEADRVEIGYWLRADYTGSGIATEAARAMLAIAMDLPGIRRVEIRCDPRNERSAAVPRRLGFRLATPTPADSSDSADMVWSYHL